MLIEGSYCFLIIIRLQSESVNRNLPYQTRQKPLWTRHLSTGWCQRSPPLLAPAVKLDYHFQSPPSTPFVLIYCFSASSVQGYVLRVLLQLILQLIYIGYSYLLKPIKIAIRFFKRYHVCLICKPFVSCFLYLLPVSEREVVFRNNLGSNFT